MKKSKDVDTFDLLRAEKKQLLEQVKQLQAENEELKEENRWIPVSEKLPEESGLYLVCDFSDYNRNEPIFVVSWFDADKKYLNYDSATHWKPIILPEQALKESTKT